MPTLLEDIHIDMQHGGELTISAEQLEVTQATVTLLRLFHCYSFNTNQAANISAFLQKRMESIQTAYGPGVYICVFRYWVILFLSLCVYFYCTGVMVLIQHMTLHLVDIALRHSCWPCSWCWTLERCLSMFIHTTTNYKNREKTYIERVYF